MRFFFQTGTLCFDCFVQLIMIVHVHVWILSVLVHVHVSEGVHIK